MTPPSQPVKDDYDLTRAARFGLLIGMWVAGPILAFKRFSAYGQAGAIGQDARAYWLTAHTHTLYGGRPGEQDSFLYSPVFAQVIHPLAHLPFAWFVVVVIAVDASCFVWLLWPLGWQWVVPCLLFLAPEFTIANIIGVLTLAAVLGVSGRGAWWSVGYLTKVGPGLLGAAWHAPRREWRPILVSWGVSSALAAVSFVTWPSAWRAWFHLLTESGSAWTTGRLVAALALAAVASARRWWWAIPVCLILGAPVYGQGTYGYLAGLVRLRPTFRERRNAAPALAEGRRRGGRA